MNIENMYKLARQGTMPTEYVNYILQNGFDDYNNDYRSEIHFIIKTIFKNDKYTIEDSNIPTFVKLLHFHGEDLFKEFFNKLVNENIAVSANNFELLLDQKVSNPNINIKYKETIEQSRDNFINYVLNQEGFQPDELALLTILTKHPTVAEKILSKKELKVSQTIYDYLKEHSKYKDLIINKQIEIISSNDSTLSHLAKELVLTANYMDDFLKQDIKYDSGYLNNFFNNTYDLIFDENNSNRDKFNFEFVKKQVKIAVDTMNYAPVFSQKTIEDMRKSYGSNHPFSKLKK